MSALLAVRDLHAGYGPIRVLHEIDLEVGTGEIVAVLGANGAGKTTLLRAISGLGRASGSVRIDGREVLGRPAERLARLGIGHVPEGRGTFIDLTVEENLRVATRSRVDIERWYDQFPVLAQRRRQLAGTLSGGEQQMLAIARTLLSKPRVLLLDEPSTGLAPTITREVFRILAEVRALESTAMLIVEQNASLALDLADRAYVLETGRIVLGGPSNQLRYDDAVRGAYLGY